MGKGGVLRLIGTEESAARVPRGGSGLRLAVRGRRAERIAVGLLAGIVAGVCLVVLLIAKPEAGTALYKRATAFTLACEAAGVELSMLRRALFFTDDCTAPIVTPVLGQEGYLIVSRTAEGHTDGDDGGRVRYSVKMDGRATDKWRIVEVKRAPNRLTVDASLLPTASSALPKSARH